MALLGLVAETLLGEEPKPYDWRLDPRARPNPDEMKHISVHVEQCTIRQIEIKQMFAQMRMDRYHDRRLLVANILSNSGVIVALVLALMGGANSIDGLIRAFIGP